MIWAIILLVLFSAVVAWSRRGNCSHAGLDANTIADTDASRSRKAESVVSAGERRQSLQPFSSNNVASGSRQTDVVLPAQVPKVNVTTGRTANAPTHTRCEICMHCSRLWIHIYTSYWRAETAYDTEETTDWCCWRCWRCGYLVLVDRIIDARLPCFLLWSCRRSLVWFVFCLICLG